MTRTACHIGNRAAGLEYKSKQYRLCKYIFAYVNGEDVYLGNLLNHSVILIDHRQYAYITHLTDGQELPEALAPLIELLIKESFLVSDIADFEEGLIRNRYRTTCEEATGFGITVGLTLKCNFACGYCYEEHTMPSLSQETSDRIRRHFLKKLGTFNKFAVLWFGGEPLLCLNRMKELSWFFLEHCDALKIPVSAYIITNGYMLTSKIADQLLAMRIHDVQITIDGMADSHDKSRPLKSGTGTFDRIIANLREVSARIPSVRIRTNVSDQSISELKGLVDIVSSINANKNVAMQFIPVHRSSLALAGPCEGCDACSLATRSNYSNWRSVVNEAEEYAGLKGLNAMVVRHRSGLPYCNAYMKNCIIVDPKGNCYYCTGDIGREERRIGFLNHDGDIIHDGLNNEYNALDPFREEECRQCEILPLCMGGCFKFAIKNGLVNGRCMMKELFPTKFPRAVELGVKDPIGSCT